MAAYYIRLKGKVWGPFSLDHLKGMQGQGRLSTFHEVSHDRVNWSPVSSVPELGIASPGSAQQSPVNQSLFDVEAVDIRQATPIQGSRRRQAVSGQEAESSVQNTDRDFQAWENQIGWARVRTGLFLLITGCCVSVGNLVIFAVGFISAVAGDNPAGLVFIITLCQFGRAVAVLLELAGAGFCTGAPKLSGARTFGIAAFVLLILHTLLSVYPSIYLVQVGFANRPAPFLHQREIAGVVLAVLVFLGLSTLTWVAWNTSHLYYLEVLNRCLRTKDASSLPMIAVYVFLGAVVLGLLSTCLLATFSEFASNRPGNVRHEVSSLVMVMLLGGLSICLWIGYFVVYILALLSVLAVVKEQANTRQLNGG